MIDKTLAITGFILAMCSLGLVIAGIVAVLS